MTVITLPRERWAEMFPPPSPSAEPAPPVQEAPTPAADLTPAPVPTPAPIDLSSLEDAVLRGINAERRKHGLRELRANPEWAALARAYSRRQATEHFYAHRDPAGHGPIWRAEQAHLSYGHMSEVIGGIPGRPEEVVMGWMHSPGHRTALLERQMTDAGVGAWRDERADYVIYTVDFMTLR